MKNMLPLKRRKLKFRSRTWAVATLQNLESLWKIIRFICVFLLCWLQADFIRAQQICKRILYDPHIIIAMVDGDD